MLGRAQKQVNPGGSGGNHGDESIIERY